MNTVSQIVILALGVIVCTLSLWGMLAPRKLMQLVGDTIEKEWGIHLAVIVRLLLGAALIIVASESRFPQLFEFLGWIAVVAAIAIVFLGRQRMRQFIGWFDRLSPAFIRTWLLFGLAFGAFLVYGVV